MDLSIVVVNYNTSGFLKKCIDALEKACEGLDHETFVVDNASPEGFPEDIESSYDYLRVIKNEKNVGFARANNQALRICLGEMILILNPDVEVSSKAIKEMFDFLKSEAKAGAVGCRTYWDQGTKFQFSTLKMPDIITALLENTFLGKLFPQNSHFQELWDIDYNAWNSQVPVPVKGLPAAILMLKKEVLHKIDYFDEDFFLYYEDKDLCKRILDEGYEIYFLPHVEVIHHYGQSTRKENTEFLEGNIKESRERYYMKHFGLKGVLLKFSIKVNDFLIETAKKILGLIKGKKAAYLKSDRELKLSWQTMNSIRQFCLEISVEPHFLHKVGLFLNEQEYALPSEMISKIPPANYFWRCIGFKENGEKITLNSGNFIKQ